MPTVTTGFQPRAGQYNVLANFKRFNVIVCHRRWGKTVMAINKLIDAALRSTAQRPRFAYIAPLYRQAKQIAWDFLKSYTQPIKDMQYNESELRADFPNGSRITLYGADNYDALRGIYLDGSVLDEYGQMNPKAWTEVIRPALVDRNGWSLFIGTPRGHNHFHDLYTAATLDPEWQALILRASETGVIPQRELEAARRAMNKDEYAQEFECSFEAAIPGAYFADQIRDARTQGRILELPFDTGRLVHTFWDLGSGKEDAMSVWFGQYNGDWIDLFDYEERLRSGLPQFASLLEEKSIQLGYRYGRHWAPHDVEHSEIGTGVTRKETAAKIGLNFETVPRVQRKMDAIQRARFVFPRVRIHQRLVYAIDCLTQYHTEWDERRKVFGLGPEHDFSSHCADAFMTMAFAIQDVIQSDSYDDTPYLYGSVGRSG